MPRYTVAYSSFIERLDEVNTLHRLALQKERKDPVNLRVEINALCRGSIVLLSSHLEAYIKELGELTLDSIHTRGIPRTNIDERLYYHISKEFFDGVRGTDNPKEVSKRLFNFIQSDLPYWSRIGPFPQTIPIDKFNKGFSNPGFEKIKDYFKRFGYDNYAKDLAQKMRALYNPTINMVNHLVDTRNKIAHGDSNATKTPGDIKTMTTIIRNYCSETDSVFGTWCRTNLCTIR